MVRPAVTVGVRFHVAIGQQRNGGIGGAQVTGQCEREKANQGQEWAEHKFGVGFDILRAIGHDEHALFPN
jgi:hypothetical protein